MFIRLLSIPLSLFLLANASLAQSTGARAADLPSVAVLATGGTIAQTDSKEATLLVDHLVGAVPQLKSIARVSAEQLFQVSSPDITLDNWLTLAKRVNTLLARDDIQGIVITHGTDTMEETAYFLDLVVKSVKPVVLVGSMRGSKALGADGPANLYNAVVTAASSSAQRKGVLVVMNERIHSARDVTKTNAFTLDAFNSTDFGPIGYVQAGVAYFYREPYRRHTTSTEFDVSAISSLPKVAVVYSHVGVDSSVFEGSLLAGAKGIVYAGTGNGSIPKALQPSAMKASKEGIPVVRASRVNGGVVERNGEHNDDETGWIVADSLNPQKARILLMLALTKTRDPKAIQGMFSRY